MSGFQNLPRTTFSLLIIHENVDTLHSSETFDDLAINPRDWLELAGPVGLLVRPCEPSSFMWLPFGRLAFGTPPSTDPPVSDLTIGINAPVTEEGPVPADLIHLSRVTLSE